MEYETIEELNKEMDKLLDQTVKDRCISGDFTYNGTYAWDGEDGGSFIQELKELLTPTMYQDLGIFRYLDSGDDRKELYVFETDKYKFLCVESTEVIVYDGGTCYSGSVELYQKPKEEDLSQGETFGVTEPAIYYDENGL